MQVVFEFLGSPFNQFIGYFVLLIILSVVTIFYKPVIITGGVHPLTIWMLVSSLSGISTKISWYYYFQLIIFLTAGYILLWMLAWIADKWGLVIVIRGLLLY